MMLCSADMPSYTFAMKAQKILKARGYLCEIKRNTSSAESGCGYYISVSGNCSEIR
ncbi:MAG: putative Se/S carrier-like protein, partial [Ruminococcus sp.]